MPIELPFRWEISKSHVDGSAIARRFVAGKGLVGRPNWRIIGPNGIYIPKVDEDGMLEEDYLLVTRLRNYLSEASLDTDHFVVSFGGTHGTGTRALNLLYKDRSVLKKVGDQLHKRPAAFQVLLRVGNMKHDPVAGTHARSIAIAEDPVILPDRDQMWSSAAKDVRKEFKNA
jgi:hypothetical protein